MKTSYDTITVPKLGILVRHPDGVWDDFHGMVDGGKRVDGTRPIIQLNELAHTLIYSYNDGKHWMYQECSTITITCSGSKILVSTGEDATSTKQIITSDLVVLTSLKAASGKVSGTLVRFDTPKINVAPSVDAGANQSIFDTQPANLVGVVVDDGLPGPPTSLTTTWSQLSGPGVASFANAAALHTSASFSQQGAYVLQLLASDGQLAAFDTVTISVTPTPPNQAPLVNAGDDITIGLCNRPCSTQPFLMMASHSCLDRLLHNGVKSTGQEQSCSGTLRRSIRQPNSVPQAFIHCGCLRLTAD